MRPLHDFVTRFAAMLGRHQAEPDILHHGAALLAGLVARDDWLPEEYAQPDADHYQSYLLHCDSEERFSVQSFVWGPGQFTPVHDHTVWGLIGVLRGAELNQPYTLTPDGAQKSGPAQRLTPGMVEAVSPSIGDIHRVSNAFETQNSVSIHVYGGNLARINRHVFAPDGTAQAFTSGFANTRLPNIWAI